MLRFAEIYYEIWKFRNLKIPQNDGFVERNPRFGCVFALTEVGLKKEYRAWANISVHFLIRKITGFYEKFAQFISDNYIACVAMQQLVTFSVSPIYTVIPGSSPTKLYTILTSCTFWPSVFLTSPTRIRLIRRFSTVSSNS